MFLLYHVLLCLRFLISACTIYILTSMLQATELGLGTVWVCYFRPDVIKKEFQLLENLEPVNILVIGYGREKPADPERHLTTRIPIEELVSYDYL